MRNERRRQVGREAYLRSTLRRDALQKVRDHQPDVAASLA
jgi:hypothetical protein